VMGRLGSDWWFEIPIRQVPWMTKGGIYPFTVWSDDDVTFARNYAGIFITEEDRRRFANVLCLPCK
jgi:hypothetical protein